MISFAHLKEDVENLFKKRKLFIKALIIHKDKTEYSKIKGKWKIMQVSRNGLKQHILDIIEKKEKVKLDVKNWNFGEEVIVDEEVKEELKEE